MQIAGHVGDWERWTDMTLQEGTEFVLLFGHALLRVADRVGSYREPNV